MLNNQISENKIDDIYLENFLKFIQILPDSSVSAPFPSVFLNLIDDNSIFKDSDVFFRYKSLISSIQLQWDRISIKIDSAPVSVPLLASFNVPSSPEYKSKNKKFRDPLWERQKNESEKLFAYFCTYRDMGHTRTIQRVADIHNKAYVTMNLHSQEWNWIKRAKAWADEQDRERRETIIREIKEMAKSHIQAAIKFQECLLLPAEALSTRIKNRKGKIKDFNGIPLERLFDKMLKAAHEFSSIIDIERKSRGEPNEIVKSDLTSGGEPIKVIMPMNPKRAKEDNDV